jgi:hypothetical protein
MGCAVASVVVFVLAACSESTPPQASTSSKKTTTPVVETPPKVLPDHPLTGSINNIPLENIKASWENGILTLYTGEDPNFNYGTRLILFFLLKQPANQARDIDTSKKFQNISIHVNSKEHKELEEIINSPIRVRLESGAEKDFRVQARMHLVAGKKLDVRIDGAFEIATSGLVAKNNVVDRSHDHLDTIEYVAKQYIKSIYPNLVIHFESPQMNWMSSGKEPTANGKGELQAGGYSAMFRAADSPIQIKKLQIAKKDGIWQVVNTLSANQMHSAHALTVPSRNKPPYIFSSIAARHFEKHFYNVDGGWQKIKEPMHFPCGGGQREGQKGFCEVAYGRYYKGDYKINGSYQHVKCTAKTYLFVQKNGKWVIEQILPADKKFNIRKNKIIDRKGDIWGC